MILCLLSQTISSVAMNPGVMSRRTVVWLAPLAVARSLPPTVVMQKVGDSLALRVMLIFRERFALERLTMEIAAQHKGALVLDLASV